MSSDRTRAQWGATLLLALDLALFVGVMLVTVLDTPDSFWGNASTARDSGARSFASTLVVLLAATGVAVRLWRYLRTPPDKSREPRPAA